MILIVSILVTSWTTLTLPLIRADHHLPMRREGVLTRVTLLVDNRQLTPLPTRVPEDAHMLPLYKVLVLRPVLQLTPFPTWDPEEAGAVLRIVPMPSRPGDQFLRRRRPIQRLPPMVK